MPLISIIFIHLLALASPGPDFVYISQTAASHNKKQTLLAILGVCSAIAIWVVAAISGLSVLIEHFPIIYKLLLLLGGCYLIWLGLSAIISCFKPSDLTIPKDKNNHNFFLKGLITNLANPKALAYFTSIFSVVVIHSAPHILFLIAITIVIESLIWFYLVATLFSTKLVANWYRNQLKIINFICGGAFICFGIGLLYQLIKILI